MRGGRLATIALVAIVALLAAAVVAQAAGDKITSTVKLSPSNPKINKKTKKAVEVKLTTEFKVTKPDGTREDALKAVDMTLPKGIVADAKGFSKCSYALLQANKADQCPAKSVIGNHLGVANGTPLISVVHGPAKVYLLGVSGSTIKFGIFTTAVEVPTAHTAFQGTMKPSSSGLKIHLDVPRLPTAPGLPDGTNLSMLWKWNVRGPKGTLLRAKQACKGGWKVTTRATFVDGSTATETAKTSC
ncbi:MAG TPA: hypothetical protein VKB54_10510 [Solirubrobacteraceae bacterium]|nr:hypothetical protein [Solirubrobacteraceae bacterium]